MPLPDHEVHDPRMKRTRRFLQDGLRNLLHQKTLDEVLIQDITDVATVNRATFYDHYTDKFDLFNALIAADFQKLLEQRGVCFGKRDDALGLEAIITAVGTFLELMHQQGACTRQASSEPLIDSAITLAIRRLVIDGLQKEAKLSSPPPDVVGALVAGAIYGAVKESLSQRNWQADPTALRSVVHLILPLLQS